MSFNKILVFDVETTGLIPKFVQKIDNSSPSPINIYPYILQLGFVIYDIQKQEITKIFNKYICPPENVFISPNITEITGITRSICDKEGIDIVDALKEFYYAYMECGTIVSHNLAFDQPLIEVEIHRNYNKLKLQDIDGLILFNSLFNKINNKELFCTMKIGKNICNIVKESNNKLQVNSSDIINKSRTYIKYPKLSELYEKLFSEIPQNLHDAKTDTLLCLRCFIKIKYDIVIDISNQLI